MMNIIVAMDIKGAIGRQGKLPWHIKEDLQRFKAITSNHPIIMGRKTFESFGGKVLPNRKHVVITRDKNWSFESEEVIVTHSIEEAISKAKELDQEIFIIGGREIYKQSLELADRIYLTIIDLDVKDADIFFPEYKHIFNKEISKEEMVSSNGIKLQFLILEK